MRFDRNGERCDARRGTQQGVEFVLHVGARGKHPIAAALPGLVVGCVVYLAGSLLGPRFGPGWTDVLQGSSFFVGLILIVIGVRRRRRRAGIGLPLHNALSCKGPTAGGCRSASAATLRIVRTWFPD